MKVEQVSLEFEDVIEKKEEDIGRIGKIIIAVVVGSIILLTLFLMIFVFTRTAHPTDKYDYMISIDGSPEVLMDTYRFEDDGVFMYMIEGENIYHYIVGYEEIIVRPIKLSE